ncbi:MAG: hypothetical protein ACI9KE_004211, partial [Polyangiales bacterium]
MPSIATSSDAYPVLPSAIDVRSATFADNRQVAL